MITEAKTQEARVISTRLATAHECSFPDPKPSEVATWLIERSGYRLLWKHYLLSVCSLDDIGGMTPALKSYPEAEFEIILVTLDSFSVPDPTNPRSLRGLSPLNYAGQFHGVTRSQAETVARHLVLLLVEGRLPFEVCGIRGGRELWDSVIADLARLQTEVAAILEGVQAP